MSNLNDIVTNICKVGQGALCCKYLIAGGNGFECCKTNGMRKAIDEMWSKTQHVAQGDNCEGKNSIVLNLKPETQN